MTIARAHLVDPSVTRWYHCMTRCVRRAFLLGEGMHDRKSWIEHRLEELAEIFSVAVAGFAILDNHLHLLVRLDPDVARGWSDEDVVRRWGRLFPPRDKARQVVPVSEEWVQARLKDARWVATARQRLQSLSWFMKCLKEPLSRLANPEEQTRGAFFEGRFKSVAILDEESLLATCAYIDLNPVAAGIAEVPEASAHTSIKQRGEHVKEQGRTNEPERRPSRQRPGLDCGGGPGGGAVALSGRGSTAAGFVTRRDDRRIPAGQLRASGGIHRAVVPRGQSRDLRRAGRDLRAAGK
jgi:REP element-mobilizing transposase RayT